MYPTSSRCFGEQCQSGEAQDAMGAVRANALQHLSALAIKVNFID